jgi:hypothetical protein
MAEQHDDPGALDADVEEALRLQDEALALLERLRAEEPYHDTGHLDHLGGGRRDFRRWPPPEGVTLELHDGLDWHQADVLDLAVGGARLNHLPEWMKGPAPARLKAPAMPAVLVLVDVMWRDKQGRAGIRFEFTDNEERDLWSGGLIDALLARHALG